MRKSENYNGYGCINFVVSVFSVSECNLVLIKSLFKSSFGQSNVVFRGRFVVCSGDLCVVDNAGRQAIVVERHCCLDLQLQRLSLSWLLLLDSTFLLCLLMIDFMFSIQL